MRTNAQKIDMARIARIAQVTAVFLRRAVPLAFVIAWQGSRLFLFHRLPLIFAMMRKRARKAGNSGG